MPLHNIDIESLVLEMMKKSDDTQFLSPDFFRFPANPFLRNPFLKSSVYWDAVTKHMITLPGTFNERFCEHNEHVDPDIVQAFGDRRPSSNSFLLHHAQGDDSKYHRVPVLLIHGAGHNANIWADPFHAGGSGLVQFLSAKKYAVFAITFAHPHGDNYLQAEQLAEAIRQVRRITGRPQVDLVMHSKGGIPSRMYLSNVKKDWGTSYRGDVRRIVMLGVPNRGLDYSFRKPLLNYIIYATGASGALSWDKMIYWGQIIDTSKYSVYDGGAYPGQSQMLYRWDKKYSLDIMQPDWWTTYYGGEGFISHSQGIDQSIAQGGDLINMLEGEGIDKDVEIAVLAGNKSGFGVFFGDMSGSSDGLIFVESAFYTNPLTQNGARLLVKEEMPVNHLDLITSPAVWEWISKQLEV